MDHAHRDRDQQCRIGVLPYDVDSVGVADVEPAAGDLGEELVVVVDGELAVEYDGELLAVVSRRWLHVRDTYGVDVVRDDADPALLIAVAVCVIHLAEKERGDD